MRRSLLPLPLLLLAAACTSVDSTEHCVLTRYGKVIEEQMSVGLAFTPFSDATCFTMTEQNFPSTGSSAEAGKESMTAQTRDQLSVEGDVSIVYRFDPRTVAEVFREKRSQAAAEVEVLNGIREGYRTAVAGWSTADIFSPRRTELADSVQAHIQRKIGNRAVIEKVFVRDIKTPKAIEDARVAAVQQNLVLDKAQKQYVIDSVEASGTLLRARATSEAKRLEAESYSQNPRLLELEIARAQAEGLSKACQGVQTCVIGGSVADTWRRP